jgi:hypothetical protein
MKHLHYDELTPRQREIALEEHREINLYDGWWLDTFDTFQDMGIDIIYHSRDAVRIKLYLQPEQVADEILLTMNNNELAIIAKDYKQDGDLEAFIDRLEEEITSWLADEEDHLSSDEQVEKTIINEDLKFWTL